MNASAGDGMPDPPPGIVQPCSEACAACTPIGRGWSDYALCGNPAAPGHGYPVRFGRECRYFLDPWRPPAAPTGDDLRPADRSRG